MPKMLLATLDFPPARGGGAAYYRNLAEHLPSQSLVVLAPQAAGANHTTHYTLYRRPLLARFLWPRWLPLLFFLTTLAWRERASLIAAGQVLPVGTAALFVKAVLRIPYIVFTHGMDLAIIPRGSRKWKVAKAVLKGAHVVVANSSYTRNLVLGFSVPESKVVIISPCPNITLKRYPQAPQAAEALRGRFRLAGKRVLLTVGRLVRRKGIDTVLAALPAIAAAVPDLAYAVVGDGPERENLEQDAKSLSTHLPVIFTGVVSDEELAQWYALCEVFIMLSRELPGDVEGFGIVYLEANSFGKPVIGTRSGGVADAVVDGETGILVPPDDPKAAARAVVELLAHPDRARAMGEQGMRRASEQFQWQVQVKRLQQLLG